MSSIIDQHTKRSFAENTGARQKVCGYVLWDSVRSEHVADDRFTHPFIHSCNQLLHHTGGQHCIGQYA